MKHLAQDPQVRLWSLITVLVGMGIFYFTFLFGMPSLSDIQTNFKESSVIYDKEWGQLYTFYGGDENRQYVPYENISIRMTQAIVAMEDQRFFSNLWFDFFGIARSALTCAMGGQCGGWSSLSQQLIKNTILSNERTWKRKIRELILALHLNVRYSKEKILELYLNKISFWGNSYGVEQASRRFFGKSSQDLTILESAILASLPKSPTAYNPYTNRDRLMGYVYFIDDKESWLSQEKKIDATSAPQSFDFFKKAFWALTWENDGDSIKVCNLWDFQFKNGYKKNSKGCETVGVADLVEFLNALQIKAPVNESGASTLIEYQVGRKDRVLMRMLEDWYINAPEFGQALVSGVDFVFQDPKESIRYPHFVFYVRQYLVDMFGEEFFEQWGWKIYTTIDPKLQDKAQEIIDSYAKTTFKNYGINNGALISLDNVTRDIVAMVWSQDYYNKEIDGEVNIITSLKQPWSSMKPLIYARAFEENNISTDTTIFDVETDFGNYKPKNFDGKFLWPMTIRTALAASRNTTAIKMWFLATRSDGANSLQQEHNLVSYLNNMGLNTITKQPQDKLYWPPMALWSAEVRPLDFSAVYAAMANNGSYMAPNPIIKIIDTNGTEIPLPKRESKQVMKPGAAYMISHILSDNEARPAWWNIFLTLSDKRKAAVKTGTSNKKVWENILPRDLWTVGYTPQYTTVVWTGNTDGKPAAQRASGMESSALIWKKFMDFEHTEIPKADFIRPDSVSGNDKFLYIDGQKPDILSSFAPEKIQIDVLCNGKVDQKTPKESIRDAVVLSTAFPIEDLYPTWRTPIDSWLWSDDWRQYLIDKIWVTDTMLTVVAPPDKICDRPAESIPEFTSNLSDDLELFSGIYPLEIDFSSQHAMKEAHILVNDVFYRSVNLNETKKWKAQAEFAVNIQDGSQQIITLRLIDTYGFSTSRNYRIKVLDNDTTSPAIQTQNPGQITIKSGSSVNFSGSIQDTSNISKIQIFVNDIIYGTLQDTNKYSFSLQSPSEIPVWTHTIIIQATDFQKNMSKSIHTVTVQP